jgi:hypothetical protein
VQSINDARVLALLARQHSKPVTVYGVTERGGLSLISD